MKWHQGRTAYKKLMYVLARVGGVCGGQRVVLNRAVGVPDVRPGAVGEGIGAHLLNAVEIGCPVDADDMRCDGADYIGVMGNEHDGQLWCESAQQFVEL